MKVLNILDRGVKKLSTFTGSCAISPRRSGLRQAQNHEAAARDYSRYAWDYVQEAAIWLSIGAGFRQ
ncbi:MAG: hypothetical protein LKI80_16180 [Sporolactobacillus sp.]|jgi:hypothetical protein|nr:hypothetical protein [Sporolactobacillus sp.]